MGVVVVVLIKSIFVKALNYQLHVLCYASLSLSLSLSLILPSSFLIFPSPNPSFSHQISRVTLFRGPQQKYIEWSCLVPKKKQTLRTMYLLNETRDGNFERTEQPLTRSIELRPQEAYSK